VAQRGNSKSRGLDMLDICRGKLRWSGHVARTGGKKRCIQGCDGES
jgi:hypothetical protein